MKSDAAVVSLIVGAVLIMAISVLYLDNSRTAETGQYSFEVPRYVRSESAEGSGYNIEAPIDSCYDSDGGKNYRLKGTLTIGTSTWTDKCDPQSGKLEENWCQYGSNGQPTRGWATVDCPSLCRDGACII